MRFTIELPDDLFSEAEAVASRQGISLDALVARALVRDLHGPILACHPRFGVDESGWPVLQTGGEGTTVVTDAFVSRLADSELDDLLRAHERH
ncbi:MAG: hypothetical protein JNJ70_22095 [Verrucomicrobiales bacterium]|nr:hypothetical protein [Verrucomicrobiales bacterium]